MRNFAAPWMAAHERVSRALGLAASIPKPNPLHPQVLDHVPRALHRHGEGYAMAGFLIAVAVTVLFAVLFDD